MKLGAYDYVTKPLFPDEILLSIKTALQKTATKQDNNAPLLNLKMIQKNATGKSKTITSGQYIFSDSPEFKSILKQIDLVSPTNYSILIYGESGSGKEAIAQEIHKRSKRKDSHLWQLIAVHFQKNWQEVNYLDMKKDRLPVH